jgi:hypothetical protein
MEYSSHVFRFDANIRKIKLLLKTLKCVLLLGWSSHWKREGQIDTSDRHKQIKCHSEQNTTFILIIK